MLSKYYLILVKSYDELDEWRPFLVTSSVYSKSYIKRLARANLLDITSMLGIIDGSAYDSFYRYFCSVSERAF